MADADTVHTYELTADGALIVTPPPAVEHQRITSLVNAWLLRNGAAPELVLTEVGVAVGSPVGRGGRAPDLVLLKPGREDTTGLHERWLDPADIQLIVEITSPTTRDQDHGAKVREYAAAGIAHYWIIDRDRKNRVASIVTRRRLVESGYVAASRSSYTLSQLLASRPVEHGIPIG